MNSRGHCANHHQAFLNPSPTLSKDPENAKLFRSDSSTVNHQILLGKFNRKVTFWIWRFVYFNKNVYSVDNPPHVILQCAKREVDSSVFVRTDICSYPLLQALTYKHLTNFYKQKPTDCAVVTWTTHVRNTILKQANMKLWSHWHMFSITHKHYIVFRISRYAFDNSHQILYTLYQVFKCRCRIVLL